MRQMRPGIHEHFRRQVIEGFHPEPGSEIALALEEADALEAERAALQPSLTTAVERVRALEAILYPRPRASAAGGALVRTPQTAERERGLAELKEARAAESAVLRALAERHRRVTAIQERIIDMLSFSVIDDAARATALERVTRVNQVKRGPA